MDVFERCSTSKWNSAGRLSESNKEKHRERPATLLIVGCTSASLLASDAADVLRCKEEASSDTVWSRFLD